MFIDKNIIKQIIAQYAIDVTGVFHIGAHECEEMDIYQTVIGVTPDDIVWIDADEKKVVQSIERGIPNVYHALVTDKDDELMDFHVANNGQSSSILELGQPHMQDHPDVYYTHTVSQYTVTIDTFFERTGLDPRKYVFWNFDIQGAELLALKGAPEAIKYAKIMYLEVNQREMYKDCARIWEIDAFLDTHGFKRIYADLHTMNGWGDAIYVRV